MLKRSLNTNSKLIFSYTHPISKKKLRYMKNNITVIWGGTLAVFLARLKKKPFEVIRIEHDAKAQIKRFGVYYMCIDDLPL